MKKLLLIPLVAFFACATAWATNPTTADDLQAAVNAAMDNVATTITLGGHISSEGTIVSIPSGKVITLDLNGCTLTSNAVAADEGAVPAIVNEGVLHLQGAGSISSPNNIAIYNGDPDNLSWFGPSSSPKRRAMARKAMLENDDPTEPWITFSGSFNVNGGEYAVLNLCLSFSTEEPSENITFLSDYTGEVTGSVESMMGTKDNIKVNGGKFSEDISKNATIAEEYHIELVEDWYVLVEGAAPKVYVAQVGDTQYESFKEAFEAIANMDAEGYTEQTVTLLMDVDLAPADSWEDELDNQINKSVTLDLNGHNITAALPSSYRCIFRMTSYDATLTITGNGQFIMTAEALWGDPWTLSFENIIDNRSDSHIVLNGGSYPVAPVASYMPMGYTASLTEGYYVVAEDNNDPRKLFNDYITGNSSELFTVSANTDMSGYGPYQITGTKNIKVNDGVTLKLHYKYDENTENGSPLYVDNGGSLTLTGNGTIVSNVSPIYVVNGGSLTIGATDGSDALNINTVRDANEIFFQKDYAIENHGVATIYNVVMDARSNAIYNRADGEMYIKKATIVGHSNSVTDTNGRWAYAVINGGKMVMNNASVTGIHGAVSCESGNGTLELHNCDLKAKNLDNNGGVHYALYVCTKAIVSAYNTKFYSDNASNTIYIGDNDSQNSFGLIYLYDGCKTNRKLYVQQKRGQDDDILFPVLVSTESAWYSAALNGGFGPLPANVEYQVINEVIDGLTYSFATVSTATKTEDATGTTIPWQQNTTWTDTQVDHVPSATTTVTIPAGKTVVVSKDEADKDAVAEQIFLADGAKLTVETGTTLKVGEGGINVANGGQIVVEPGAIVTVGATGLVTTEEDAVVVESSEQQQGVLLLNPDVTENTQPKATVKLVTKAKQIAANDYIYERFAIPTIDGNATVYKVEDAASVVLYPGETELKHGLYKWDGSDWAFMSSFKQMEPFKGYQLTNNSANANVVYTFEGNLVGNHNEDYSFASAGFGFFGNSYTGAIDIKRFMDSFGDKMQKTIWIYDYYTDGFKTITPESYGTVKYGTRRNSHGTITEIRSMQAFLMNRSEAGSTTINYESAIWGNPKYGLVSDPGLAPKRVAANEDKVTIYVATDTQEDEVTFIRSNEYSSAFDNGADASKWMNNGMNLYVANDDENMAIVASDEIVDMTIAFRSGNESEYTLGFDNLRGETFELRDVLTGATIQMTEGATYTFSQEANTTVPARFQIIGAKKVPTGVENVSEGANVQQKVVKNGVLYILRDNKWYNAQGQMVK